MYMHTIHTNTFVFQFPDRFSTYKTQGNFLSNYFMNHGITREERDLHNSIMDFLILYADT